jgi:hypothetical protein
MAVPSVASAATRAQQDAWFATAVGRGMNPDGMYGYQCVDVADDYCIALWGNWRNTIGAVGTADQLYGTASTTYFTKIRNNPSDSNQIPQHGDIVVFSYGHVAVVDSANTANMSVLQQDGNHPTWPCQRGTLTYYVIIGWLRPKLDDTPFTVSVKSNFSTGEHVVINWSAWPNAVKYGLSVWKPPYGADQYLVWDNYVTGTSRDIGTLPVGTYCVKMKPYYSVGGGPVSVPVYFSVSAPPVVKPALAGLSRTSARRGVTVTLSGSGFGASRGGSTVKFGGTSCRTYGSWSATRITVKVPATAKLGTLKVTVVTATGTSNARTFTVKR